MDISPDFKNAVDKKNIRLTRIMLKDSLVIDPTYKEFNALLKYAENNLFNLYDEHDGEKFNNNIASWNKDYLNEQMVNVVYNFSKERISFLRSICKYIYADNLDIKEEKKCIEHCIASNSKKQIGIGIVALGVAIAIAGAVTSHNTIDASILHNSDVTTSHNIFTVAGVVVAVVGGAIYFFNINGR